MPPSRWPNPSPAGMSATTSSSRPPATRRTRLAIACLLFPTAGAGDGLKSPAPDRPLKVHMIGAGEYDPVESLTGFKDYVEKSYRVECTTSFKLTKNRLDNLDALKSADVLVLFARRLNLPEDQMSVIRQHWEKGKPIVGIRTASHAFQKADNEILD